jgi:hypothetical protein
MERQLKSCELVNIGWKYKNGYNDFLAVSMGKFAYMKK